jgi:hypothetical protein
VLARNNDDFKASARQRRDGPARECSDSYCWLRSANADDSDDVANLDDGSVDDDDYDDDDNGLSPDCSCEQAEARIETCAKAAGWKNE